MIPYVPPADPSTGPPIYPMINLNAMAYRSGYEVGSVPAQNIFSARPQQILQPVGILSGFGLFSEEDIAEQYSGRPAELSTYHDAFFNPLRSTFLKGRGQDKGQGSANM